VELAATAARISAASSQKLKGPSESDPAHLQVQQPSPDFRLPQLEGSVAADPD
jgi:hypothetical protein